MEKRLVWNWFDLILVCFFSFGFLYFIFILLKYLEIKKISSLFAFFLFLIQDGILLFFVWILIIRKYRINFSYFGLKKYPVVNSLVYGFSGLLASLFLILIVGFFFNLFNLPGFSGETRSLVPIFGNGFLGFCFSVSAAGIIAPFVEEIFFRGFIQSTLSKYLGNLFALLLTSFIFAFSHLEFDLFVPLFIFGLVLGYLYLSTRSLWPSIFMHALKNLGAVFIMYLMS